MAENQNDDNKPQNDENDPYKFFKFPEPDNNNDKDKRKKNNGKKKMPFWPILLLTLFVVAMAEVFFFPKNKKHKQLFLKNGNDIKFKLDFSF